MIGIVDTISDANPDGTIFSPHVSSMLLHDMNSSPTTTSFHPSPFGTRRLLPLNRQISTISVAEISDRVADTTGTGRCSPATWIAPYVDPQNKYTLPKASSTIVDFGIRENIFFHATGRARGNSNARLIPGGRCRCFSTFPRSETPPPPSAFAVSHSASR